MWVAELMVDGVITTSTSLLVKVFFPSQASENFLKRYQNVSDLSYHAGSSLSQHCTGLYRK